MEKILLFFLLLFNFCVYSQNINVLDNNNGFRNFKFGSHVNTFKNIKYTGKAYNNMAPYTYTGNDIKSIQEVPVDDITLYFYEKKLAAIIISFGHSYNYTKLQFDQVNYGLNNTFGKPYLDCQTGVNDVIDCDVWQGKKVILEHNRLRDSDGKSAFGYLVFEDILTKQKRIHSQF